GRAAAGGAAGCAGACADSGDEPGRIAATAAIASRMHGMSVRHPTARRWSLAVIACLGLAVAVRGEVGVTDGPKGVVVNPRTGKAYAAFPDLGVVKIVRGATGAVTTLKTGANVKNLTIDPRTGRVYAMNRGP